MREYDLNEIRNNCFTIKNNVFFDSDEDFADCFKNFSNFRTRGRNGDYRVTKISNWQSAENYQQIAFYSMNWHQDITCDPENHIEWIFLYCKRSSFLGGKTYFLNGFSAYKNLSSELQSKLDSLICIESVNQYIKNCKPFAKAFGLSQDPLRREWTRPFVQTSDSGEKYLAWSQMHFERFSDMTKEESHQLTDEILGRSKESIYAHKWRAGDLIIFNNNQIVHRRQGSEPFGPRRLWQLQFRPLPKI